MTPGLCLYSLEAEIFSSGCSGRKRGIPSSIPDLLSTIIMSFYIFEGEDVTWDKGHLIPLATPAEERLF